MGQKTEIRGDVLYGWPLIQKNSLAMRTFILNLLGKKLPMWRISILADIRPIGYKLSCCGSLWSG